MIYKGIFCIALSLILPIQIVSGKNSLPEAHLVADTDSIQSEKPFTAGIYFKIPQDGHIYWRNPGNSGIPTEIKWTLPKGFTAGPILWPAPQRFESPGDVTYGYANEVLLMTQINPPRSMNPSDSIRIAARVNWMLCAGSCIPGSHDLSLIIGQDSIKNFQDSDLKSIFKIWKGRLPVTPDSWMPRAIRLGNEIHLRFPLASGIDDDTNMTIFPWDESFIDPNASQDIILRNDQVIVSLQISPFNQKVPRIFRFVMVISDSAADNQVFSLEVPIQSQ